MANVLDGQLSALDLLEPVDQPETLRTPPVFKVNVSAWQKGGCGWCGKATVIGGGVRPHPNYSDVSLYYEYCAKCVGMYGEPKFWDPKFIFHPQNANGEEVEREPGLAEKVAAWRSPPFTVHLKRPTFPSQPCGYCGRELTMTEGNGGGAQSLPDGRHCNWFICNKCNTKHGSPNLDTHPNLKVIP